MADFSRDDLVFSFQTRGVDRANDFPDMDYMGFWGDQYEWTALLPVAWKMIPTNNRLIPPSGDHQAACCWWNTALHLLGLGMGWTNIATGLQNWRRLDYPTNHPILRLVFDSYGESIEALEAFLVMKPQINLEFSNNLNFGHRYLVEEFLVIRFEDFDISTPERYLEQAKIRHRFDKRWRLAENLLLGGTDPCHLSDHFPFGNGLNEGIIYEAKHYEEPEFIFEFGPRIGIRIDSYQDFPYHLNRVREAFNSDMSSNLIISVFINSLGHLGDFAYAPETNRWFYVEDLTDIEMAKILHLLGKWDIQDQH